MTDHQPTTREEREEVLAAARGDRWRDDGLAGIYVPTPEFVRRLLTDLDWMAEVLAQSARYLAKSHHPMGLQEDMAHNVAARARVLLTKTGYDHD